MRFTDSEASPPTPQGDTPPVVRGDRELPIILDDATDISHEAYLQNLAYSRERKKPGMPDISKPGRDAPVEVERKREQQPFSIRDEAPGIPFRNIYHKPYPGPAPPARTQTPDVSHPAGEVSVEVGHPGERQASPGPGELVSTADLVDRLLNLLPPNTRDIPDDTTNVARWVDIISTGREGGVPWRLPWSQPCTRSSAPLLSAETGEDTTENQDHPAQPCSYNPRPLYLDPEFHVVNGHLQPLNPTPIPKFTHGNPETGRTAADLDELLTPLPGDVVDTHYRLNWAKRPDAWRPPVPYGDQAALTKYVETKVGKMTK